jgi:hypothetical protein
MLILHNTVSSSKKTFVRKVFKLFEARSELNMFSITRCQMASCWVETVGEARMEDHWEADHKDRLVEEWHYQVSSL